MRKIIDEYTDRDDLSYYQKWKLRHPEKHQEVYKRSNKKVYSKLSPEEREARKFAERKRWKGLSEKARREKWLKSKYNLSYEQYEDMYKEQGGKCYTCSVPISIEAKLNGHDTACVDHCHTTGKIRGLLCNHCNRAIGLLKENIETLSNIINYLRNAQ